MFLIWLTAQIGTFVVWLVISAMLRFRARSVFNTPPQTPPMPVVECYARALRRVPWLVLTEVLRNISLVLALLFFVLPALFLGFRLSVATEAVVLDQPHMAGAFQESFRLTEGRFERWLEMIVVSVVLVFGGIFVGAALSVIFPGPGINAWVAATQLLIAAGIPIIQYAWTFFYLRLAEAEPSPGVEVGPAYAAASEPAPGARPEEPPPTFAGGEGTPGPELPTASN